MSHVRGRMDGNEVLCWTSTESYEVRGVGLPLAPNPRIRSSKRDHVANNGVNEPLLIKKKLWLCVRIAVFRPGMIYLFVLLSTKVDLRDRS